ncbi:PI-PLC X domain-containing protein [Hibiscus syriacus]|uniref:PI-PLC X domain-containing protein n=1 Tax=Hibiscus syriacus TaxID=106335 RepID=A0A6A2WZL3_HIBSY|nr:PI-PLC X domain-containing protein [Hibiscus syriacus]
MNVHLMQTANPSCLVYLVPKHSKARDMCSLPFNIYAFLMTHNSFANEDEPQNGARALMLHTYEYKGDIWLCHSFGGKCHDFTAFWLAICTLKQVEAFLSVNPLEIVTLFLEDYVETPNALSKLFQDAGLMKHWFPVSNMPRNGQDWPLVKYMVANNQRLVVFTSKESKQESEGIAYQWNYVVENQYGDDGEHPRECNNHGESAPLDDNEISGSDKPLPFDSNQRTAGNRWANFVAVNYYMLHISPVNIYRSEGGGVFQALDKLNGQLLCGCDDVHLCKPGSSPAKCSATKGL